MELKTNTELRASAREALKGHWAEVAILTLVYGIITGIASCIPIIGLLLVIPLSFCYVVLLLNFYRGERNGGLIEKLFSPLKENYTKTLVTPLLVAVYTFLWSLLFVIPGIIKMYSYAMTFYIAKDKPELSADQAINESMKMMDGYKMKLFLLDLSFIGWIILATITFGIGFFWLQPYMSTARAAFYENLKEMNSTESEVIVDIC